MGLDRAGALATAPGGPTRARPRRPTRRADPGASEADPRKFAGARRRYDEQTRACSSALWSGSPPSAERRRSGFAIGHSGRSVSRIGYAGSGCDRADSRGDERPGRGTSMPGAEPVGGRPLDRGLAGPRLTVVAISARRHPGACASPARPHVTVPRPASGRFVSGIVHRATWTAADRCVFDGLAGHRHGPTGSTARVARPAGRWTDWSTPPLGGASPTTARSGCWDGPEPVRGADRSRRHWRRTPAAPSPRVRRRRTSCASCTLGSPGASDPARDPDENGRFLAQGRLRPGRRGGSASSTTATSSTHPGPGPATTDASPESSGCNGESRNPTVATSARRHPSPQAPLQPARRPSAPRRPSRMNFAGASDARLVGPQGVANAPGAIADP